ncbi:hypothetical protein CO614_08930 [Lysobacteraceae bacterium NML120232]|nr:hypothetical protein CO608_09295 [Xanthomonadaceae bacterium NML08-0793]PJK09681.1 hypothetical protein CO614_08930 [Xanthomonadaceae bacterium NML120232]
MNKILILYPSVFNVLSKFNRKLNRILQNKTSGELVYLEDPRDFIVKYSQDNSRFNCQKIKNIQSESVTHAIVFDDGEEFPRELEWLKENKIPLRWIKIPITRVININKDNYQKYSKDQYEYIGRSPNRKNSPNWSNPYSMYDFQVGDDENQLSREDVIRKFEYGFNHDNLPTNLKRTDTYQLAGKRLGCHCKPYPCHGDVIADFLNSWDDGN